MDNLNISPSRALIYTPAINFNAETGYCSILGDSIPEDAPALYDSIIKWLWQFFENEQKPLTLNINLNFYDSASALGLMKILKLCTNHQQKNYDITINWYYNDDDDDLIDDIKEIISLTNSFVNLIPNKK